MYVIRGVNKHGIGYIYIREKRRGREEREKRRGREEREKRRGGGGKGKKKGEGGIYICTFGGHFCQSFFPGQQQSSFPEGRREPLCD
jgi:hypothetical protein